MTKSYSYKPLIYNFIALCGGSLIASADPQTVTSPGYPSPSLQPLRCRWIIDTPEVNQHVRLVMTALNLISDIGCTFEYIEYRDHPSVSWEKIMEYYQSGH